MATPVAETPAHNDIELPPAVHWPTVYAMAGIGGGLAVVLLTVALLGAAQRPPTPQPAVAAAPVAAVLPPLVLHAAPTVKPVPAATTPPTDPGPPVVQPRASQPALVPITVSPTPLRFGVPLYPSAEPSAPLVSSPAPPWQSDPRTEYDLYADLRRYTHDVDLNTVKGTSDALLGKTASYGGAKAPFLPAVNETVVELIARRPDLVGLPVRGKSECTKKAEEAKAVEQVSKALQCVKFPKFPHPVPGLDISGTSDNDPDPGASRQLLTADGDAQLLDLLTSQGARSKEDIASVVAQMLQAEAPSFRLTLAKMLATIKGRAASEALARQALFDLSSEVREAAVKALKDRPSVEYRPILLDSFRHPWPPVANHAAQALLALDEREAVPALTAILALGDPAAPTRNAKGQWEIAEVVKVNHLSNCLLCHAPSHSKDDHVPGFIPQPGRSLPDDYIGRTENGDFVRADITYLRQDFSVFEAVEHPGKWPAHQRFDYMLRKRPLTNQELIDLADVGLPSSETYPQREAIQYVLTKLKEADAIRPIEKAGLGP